MDNNETLRTYKAIDITLISGDKDAINLSSNASEEQKKILDGDDVIYSHTELYEDKASHVYNIQRADKDFQERVKTNPELHEKLLEDFEKNPQPVKTYKHVIAEELDLTYDNANDELKKELEKATYVSSEMNSKGVVSHTFIDPDKDNENTLIVEASPDFSQDTQKKLNYKTSIEVEGINEDEKITSEQVLEEDQHSEAYIRARDRFNHEHYKKEYNNPYHPSTEKQEFEDYTKGWIEAEDARSELLTSNEKKEIDELYNNISSFNEKEEFDNVPDYQEFDYSEVKLSENFRAEELDSAYQNAKHEEQLALDSDDFHYSRTEAYENGDVKHLFFDDIKNDTVRIDASDDLAKNIREELKISKDDFFNSIDIPENKDISKLKRKDELEKKDNKSIDSSLDRKFTIVNKGNDTVYSYSNDPSKIAIKESRSKISTKESTPAIVNNVLQIAEDKGWSSIKVKGTKEFKKSAWLEGNLKGLEVKGYTPTEQDIRKLESESEKRGVNLITEDKTPEDKIPEKKVGNDKQTDDKQTRINDLKEAMSNLSKEDAIKKHPSLEKIYEIEPSAISFYQAQKGLPKSQENEFVRKATDRAIEVLSSGKALPNFESKENTKQEHEPPKTKTVVQEEVTVKTTKQKDIDFD